MNDKEEIRQLSKAEAVALYETKWWEDANDASIAAFQMSQDRLCCPMSVFNKALSNALGRSVYTHEHTSSNKDNLLKELQGKIRAPTFEEILALLTNDKT